MSNIKVIRPQKGPQEKFLSTTADIAIYGGAAGDASARAARARAPDGREEGL